MRIGVAVIAKDEANYVGRAMQSCDFCDAVALVDGDSTDATIEVAIGHLMPVNPNCQWFSAVIPWENDFGAQRQHALDLLMHDPANMPSCMRSTIDGVEYEPPDWWMRLDSDEAYSSGFRRGVRQLLEMLPQEILAVRVRQTNLYPDVHRYVANIGGWETHPRIFRMGPQYQWVGAVHEHVQMMTRDGLVDISEKQIVSWNVDVFHYGWLDKSRRHAREDLYTEIPGSGVTKRGDLAERDYHIRLVPALPVSAGGAE